MYVVTTQFDRNSRVVAIPVKNEADHITECLSALLSQREVQATKIVLVLNDCVDGTIDIVQALSNSSQVPVETVVHNFPPGHGGAGYARHLAMEHAAREMRGGVLLTTDADGRVDADWIANNLAAIQQSADAVAGRAVIDPIDAKLIPQLLHDDDALECAYSDLIDEISDLIDPTPWDPWPHHCEHSGASIAVTWDAYRKAGGIPVLPQGEDREFLHALRRIDARIRHPLDVTVTVSGRIVGRAEGGMADTIHRRLIRPDRWLDDRLEPPADAARRAQLRRIVRDAWSGNTTDSLPYISESLGITGEWFRRALSCRFFGELWDMVEATSPKLVRRRVLAATVKSAIQRATAIRDRLRENGSANEPGSADLIDIVPVDVASRRQGRPRAQFGTTD